MMARDIRLQAAEMLPLLRQANGEALKNTPERHSSRWRRGKHSCLNLGILLSIELITRKLFDISFLVR